MKVVAYSAAVDWLTVTWPLEKKTGTNMLRLESVARYGAEKTTGTKADKERGRWYGYEGWQIGKCFVGERADGLCIKATGIAAQHIADQLVIGGSSVARIDLAVTVWFDRDDMLVARRAKEDVLAWRAEGGLAARQRMHHIDGCGGGDTLYIGARTSHVYARIYDKGRESKDEAYRWAWRYELEIKNRIADKVFAELKARNWESLAIASTVAAHFLSKGHKTPFPNSALTPITLYEPREPSDSEQLLSWLSHQVGPSVRRLLQEGRANDILYALGIAGAIELPADHPATDLPKGV